LKWPGKRLNYQPLLASKPGDISDGQMNTGKTFWK